MEVFTRSVVLPLQETGLGCECMRCEYQWYVLYLCVLVCISMHYFLTWKTLPSIHECMLSLCTVWGHMVALRPILYISVCLSGCQIFYLFLFFFTCESIYMCEGGFAGGYLYPVVCTHTALARALQLHPVTNTYTHNHAHVRAEKHILPLMRTFARINRGFLRPLAVVRVWNWSAGSQIWQPGPGVWDAPHFGPVSRHYLQKSSSIYLLNSCAIQIRKQNFFTGDSLHYIDCVVHICVYFQEWTDRETGRTTSVMVVLCLFGNFL